MPNGRVICVVNQKGGVGKTTTAVNLSAALATAGQSTLLLDMDPQCNATTALGQRPSEGHSLVRCDPLNDQICELEWENLSVLPGSRSFHDVDKLASAGDLESKQVRAHLDSVIESYDFVLLDCPPSLGGLTQTALSASTEVLMPIQCEYFAMEGLTQLIQVIKKIIVATDGRLTFGGILL
ncbi:MAG: AAA family ATPase, partial [Planctomycetota bacterium]